MFEVVIFVLASCLTVAVVLIGTAVHAQDRERSRRLAEAKFIISILVEQHLEVLIRKRRTTLTEDEYGVTDATKWNREVQYFADNVVLPRICPEHRAVLSDKLTLTNVFQEILEERVAAAQSDTDVLCVTASSPLEYERMCSARLTTLGWKTTVTKGSGDQGVDILAHKGHKSVAIQCKFYNGPVGNKAVQEVLAGKQYYGLIAAAVVTNATFTPSARALADSTGVTLLHDSQLDQL